MLVRNLVVLFLFACSPLTALASQYVPGEIIVKLKSDTDTSNAYQFMGKVQSEKEMRLKRAFGKMGVYHYGLRKGQTVESAISELMQDPNVAYAEPNFIIRKQSTGVITPLTDEQLQDLITEENQLPLAAQAEVNNSSPEGISSKVTTMSTEPIVAVIDTGLDVTHPVFTTSGALWVNSDEIPGNGIDDDGNGYIDDVNGWNFVSNSGAMIDDDGHGTHVSGIILKADADMDITTPPYGTAKYKIMPLKFLDGSGVGSTSDAINAIYYAVNNGAKVLNNSWGGAGYSGALHDAIAYSYSKGVAFSAASGNNGQNNDATPMYPSSYAVPHIMSVAATTSLDNLASFSNFGASSVHMGSLGQNVYSTIPGGYGTSSGTSMSTPYVSGLAALILVEQPTMLGYQIKSIIFDGSDVISSLGGKVSTEARMNAAASVGIAKLATVATNQPAYSSERGLASADAGGGCGLVSKLGGAAGGSASNLMMMIAFALILLPLAYLRLMRSENPVNRRRHDRYRIDTAVTINAGGQELVGSISSLSMGGVQLNTEALLEKGGSVSIQITPTEGAEPIEVKGKVVWSEAQKSYGVQFAGTKKSAMQQISGWMEQLKGAA